MNLMDYRNTHEGGYLDQDQPHTITFFQDGPIHCQSAPTQGILVQRVRLNSSASDALRRLGRATIIIEAVPQDRHDTQLYHLRRMVNLSIIIRNDMIQPFMDADKFIDLVEGYEKFTERIDYWHYLVRYDHLELRDGETLDVTLMCVS